MHNIIKNNTLQEVHGIEHLMLTVKSIHHIRSDGIFPLSSNPDRTRGALKGGRVLIILEGKT